MYAQHYDVGIGVAVVVAIALKSQIFLIDCRHLNKRKERRRGAGCENAMIDICIQSQLVALARPARHLMKARRATGSHVLQIEHDFFVELGIARTAASFQESASGGKESLMPAERE